MSIELCEHEYRMSSSEVRDEGMDRNVRMAVQEKPFRDH